jgi:hypothetical protein
MPNHDPGEQIAASTIFSTLSKLRRLNDDKALALSEKKSKRRTRRKGRHNSAWKYPESNRVILHDEGFDHLGHVAYASNSDFNPSYRNYKSSAYVRK